MEQPAGGRLPIRASDAEREAAARSLGPHLATGRLTLDEFSERIDRAYRAQTRDELDALSADLPSAEDAGPPASAPRKPTLVVLSQSHRPAWTIAVATFAFPFGMLALLHRDRSRVLISVHEETDETE
jgi:DUF1707 SHOCT-like domain